MKVYGSKELIEDVHRRDLCIGCGNCVNLCPYLKNYRGKTSLLFPCSLEQGRCFAHCPKTEVDLDDLSQRVWGKSYTSRPLGVFRAIKASRAGKKALKGSFQSGGTISALMHFALESGRIEGAVLTERDGLNPTGCLATSTEKIAACAGSKFMAAPTLAALNLGVREGATRLGVVGTPCQMMAVAKMRINPLEKTSFVDPVAFTAGLFCNWSLDTRLLTAFLSTQLDISTVRGMDIPPPPADLMVLDTDHGRVDIPLSEIKPLIPATCFVCVDMTSEWSDVSVGMFEGRPGWNVLIIRSEKGDEMVASAVNKGFLETEDIPEKNRQGLARAAADKKVRALRLLKKREWINSEIAGVRSAVRLKPETMDRILNSSEKVEA